MAYLSSAGNGKAANSLDTRTILAATISSFVSDNLVRILPVSDLFKPSGLIRINVAWFSAMPCPLFLCTNTYNISLFAKAHKDCAGENIKVLVLESLKSVPGLHPNNIRSGSSLVFYKQKF